MVSIWVTEIESRNHKENIKKEAIYIHSTVDGQYGARCTDRLELVRVNELFHVMTVAVKQGDALML